MSRQYFGTDGIRGRVGASLINPEFVLKLGWAVGTVIGKNNDNQTRVVIGKDTRLSGYMLESALEAGLAAAGCDIGLLGPMPTPAIAYLTRTLRGDVGIVISASHNPYFDNGIKFFSAEGTKLPDDIELAIEEQLDKPMQMVSSDRVGKAFRIEDAPGRYIEYCKSTVPSYIRLHGIKVVVDCAHGAAYHIAESVFRELGADVIKIGASPNGLNINQDSGSTHPDEMIKMVREHQGDCGIALDGDADRVLMVDSNGDLLDGDEILYLIAKDRLLSKNMQGGVVGTIMMNLAYEKAIRDLGLDFCRTNVGDRYVLQELQNRHWVLGGETSGHIVCLDKSTTGDGIVAALQVMYAMFRQQKSLSELREGIQKYPQTLLNVAVSHPKEAVADPRVAAAYQRLSIQLGNKGRIILRASGTEPVVRVMVETQDLALSDQYANELADVIRQINAGAA